MYVRREQWGAIQPTDVIDVVPWHLREAVVVYLSGGPRLQPVHEIQTHDMSVRGLPDIGFNAVVRDQFWYEGRFYGLRAFGDHSKSHNTEGVGICVMGSDDDVTDLDKWTIIRIYDTCCTRAGKRLHIVSYGELPGADTSGHGNKLNQWIESGAPAPNAPDPWEAQRGSATAHGEAYTADIFPLVASGEAPSMALRRGDLGTSYLDGPTLTIFNSLTGEGDGMGREASETDTKLTEIHDMLGTLLARPQVTVDPIALVEALTASQEAIGALTTALQERLPLVPTVDEIVRAFMRVVRENVMNNGNSSQ